MNRKKNLHSEKDMIKNTHNLKNKMTQEKTCIIFIKEQRFRKSLFNVQKGNEKLSANKFEKLDKASNLAYTQQQQQQQQNKTDLNAVLENLTSWLAESPNILLLGQVLNRTPILVPAMPSDKHFPGNSPAS